MGKDPLIRFERKLLEGELLSRAQAEEITAAMEETLADAVRFAEESPFPDPGELTDDVYTL
jgi:pyruvate dehydrogenase E1 component alpha subunit